MSTDEQSADTWVSTPSIYLGDNGSTEVVRDFDPYPVMVLIRDHTGVHTVASLGLTEAACRELRDTLTQALCAIRVAEFVAVAKATGGAA